METNIKRLSQLAMSLLTLATVLAATGGVARAAEIGHYNGGILNIRDLFLPPAPGVYGAVYNYFYTANRLNDSHGNKVSSLTINGVAVGVDVKVNMYVAAPAMIWASDWKLLGARYGAMVVPSFVDANLDAALSAVTRDGGSVKSSSFGVGDMLVIPLFLDWSFKQWDVTLNYGFWAPIGKYSTQTTTTAGGGTAKVESSDNLGFGFWTHQIQSAVAWYPWEHKATAVTTALTYENHDKKKGFDLTPGQNLTLNWGISQFLPLKKDKTLLLEVGPAGYDSWQITNDSGSAANNIRDQVHAVGGQLGLTYVPWALSMNSHGFYEYAAKDRFQGQSFGLSIAKKF
jgi:hypothetical protein